MIMSGTKTHSTIELNTSVSRSILPPAENDIFLEGAGQTLLKTLLSDPVQRALVTQLLSQDKELCQEIKDSNLSVKKVTSASKSRMRFESPTALLRRRALENRDKQNSPVSDEIEYSPGPSPVPFEKLLEGIIAFVEIRGKDGDRSGGAKSLMRAMGATVVDTFTKNVTHVVFRDGRFSTYQKAKLLGVQMVSVLWLEAVRTKKYRVPEKQYPALGTTLYDNNVSTVCDNLHKEYNEVIREEMERSIMTSVSTIKKPRKTAIPKELKIGLQNISRINDLDESNSEDIVASSQVLQSVKSRGSVFTKHNLSKVSPTNSLDLQNSCDYSDSDSNEVCINGNLSIKLKDSLEILKERETVKCLTNISKTQDDYTNVFDNFALTNINQKRSMYTNASSIAKTNKTEYTYEDMDLTNITMNLDLNHTNLGKAQMNNKPKKLSSENLPSLRVSNSLGSQKNVCNIEDMSTLEVPDSSTSNKQLSSVEDMSILQINSENNSKDITKETSDSSPFGGKSSESSKSKERMLCRTDLKIKGPRNLQRSRRNLNTREDKDTGSIETEKDSLENSPRINSLPSFGKENKSLNCKEGTFINHCNNHKSLTKNTNSVENKNKNICDKKVGRRKSCFVMPTNEESTIDGVSASSIPLRNRKKSAAAERDNQTKLSKKHFNDDENDHMGRRKSVCRGLNEDFMLHSKNKISDKNEYCESGENLKISAQVIDTANSENENASKKKDVEKYFDLLAEVTLPVGGTNKTLKTKKRKLFDFDDAIHELELKQNNYEDSRRIRAKHSPSRTFNSTKIVYKKPTLELTPVILTKTAAKRISNIKADSKNKATCLTPFLKTVQKQMPKTKIKEDNSIKKPIVDDKVKFTKPKTPIKRNKSVKIDARNEKPAVRRSTRLMSEENSMSSDKSKNDIPIVPIIRRSTLDFVSQAEMPKKPPKKQMKKSSIVCTRLHRSQVTKFENIVRKLGGFTTEFHVTSKTTHLVAGENKRTINLLRALARGCWIVRHNWIHDSLKAGQWLPEEDYELTEFSNAVKQSRIERQAFGSSYSKDLFENCGPIYVGTNTVPKCEDLEELIKLCKGTVTGCYRNAKIAIGSFVKNEDVTCVTPQWILDSITENHCQPIEHYVMHSDY